MLHREPLDHGKQKIMMALARMEVRPVQLIILYIINL